MVASAGLVEKWAPKPPSSVAGLLFTAAVGSLVWLIIHRVIFSPLRYIPGPALCRITSLWTYYHSYIGDECSQIDELHKRTYRDSDRLRYTTDHKAALQATAPWSGSLQTKSASRMERHWLQSIPREAAF